MLLVKFKKTGSFAFCSYLDCRDVIIQTINRAGINIEYSQGFNPHELLYFSPPTPLGIVSECEYFTIYTDDVESFDNKFNANAPKGMQVVWAIKINKRPDFYNLIDYAKYEIKIDNNDVPINLSNLNYEVFDEKKQTIIDIKDYVNSISYNDNVISCVVACGQKKNLKITNLVKCLKNSLNINVLNIRKIELLKEKSTNNKIDFLPIDTLF